MTRLQCTEDLYQLLRRVHEGFVFHHGCSDVHAPGFSFREADMTPSFQDLCTDAHHARLVSIGVHGLDGSPVSLTGAGEERLTELRLRHNQTARGVA